MPDIDIYREKPDERWYLVSTKRYCERRLKVHLDAGGIAAYFPRTLRWPRPAVGNPVGPLFPGYIFVRMNLVDHYRTVCWTPGVKEFVRLGGDLPAEVPPEVIEFLHRREGPDGLVHCSDEIVDHRKVQLVRGPFKDLSGIVERRLNGRQRVVLLMQFLKRQTRVEVPEAWLKAARP